MKWIKRLAGLLQDALPGKRVYYIYTHNNRHDRFRNGLKANTELSYWVACALEKQFPRFSFLRFQGEKPQRIQRITPQDVVIGHIGETYLAAAKRTKRLISFSPWCGNEDHSETVGPACVSKEVEMGQYDHAATLILLTSEFNDRIYRQQPRNFWYDYFEKCKQHGRRVRVVHQPIDLAVFRRIKTTYTTDNFLYIGNANHMKCVPDARRLVEHVGRSLHLYGTGERSINHLDQIAIQQLPSQSDFFIQPGRWEAQCVSILEAAARGFIPLVSPDTGYPYDHPYMLRYGDFDYNLKQVRAVLKLSADERRQLGDYLHQQLISDPHHNTWSTLTDVILEEVKALYV
ncbi:MAG: hypothetical protein JSS62_00265 [Verrucomicrobia bacterium]|nr:hypothetical protein [Verrucomicrobiota bacterium]MBS0646569.1 hypothetical protein [Verrucomicrobiota bacterium]